MCAVKLLKIDDTPSLQADGTIGSAPPPSDGNSADPGAPQRLQERLSHLIAQTTTDAFVAIDPQNRVIYWNKGAEDLFGWTAEETIGQSLNIIVPSVHRTAHLEAMLRLSAGGQPRLLGKRTNVTAIDREGREVFIELALTHWLDPVSGKPAGYASIMRDVSERRRFEAERDAYQRKLEEQFSAIEATSDGVAITDAAGLFIYLNRAHCTMFGYPDASALLGKPWSALYSADEAKRIEEIAIPVVFAKGSWRGEARGIDCDGRVVEQEVSLARSPNGGLVCTTRDMADRQRVIRERIRAREQLLLAERQELISRAVSGVAHDFANLMSVISASATTLFSNRQNCPPELNRIMGAANQATAMLDLILAPTRNAETDRKLYAKAALNKIVDLTAVTLKPYHSISLIALDDDIVIDADGTEFLRVLMNLCSNARDALPSEGAGSIQIVLERFHPKKDLAPRLVGAIPDGPCAVISICDSGCGIADADLARVFEPFQTTKSFGSGLGLAVVSEVVTEAGGAICVQSGSEGTKFQLIWPLAELGWPEAEIESSEGMQDVSTTRILIVDDNESVLDLIASEVGKIAGPVTAYSSPIEALMDLENNASEWDVVIVDYDMPEMNGAQLAKRIRIINPDLPIILCTALHEKELDLGDSPFDARVEKSKISIDLNQTIRRIVTHFKVHS